MQYPYSDEYMVFDEMQERYIPTYKCVLDELGIDLKSRLNIRRAANPDLLIKTTLNQVSLMIYTCIYSYAWNPNRAKKLAAICPSARNILKDAMKQQLLYYLQVGNVSRSTDKAKRELGIDETALLILQQPLRETGQSLLYGGRA